MNIYLDLKPVFDLLDQKYIIPYYQRGYRWGETQVKQLLDDIWDFAGKDRDKNEFYCLQPVVVKKINDTNQWEVIDGQQRLTTIYLILRYIENKLLKGDTFAEDYGRSVFDIEYQVRKESKAFLKHITQNSSIKTANEYIDFHYITEAYKNIGLYFNYPKNFNRSKLDTFLKVLFDNVKVIWYKVPQNTDSVEIFTRLNIGKIPLTNAELIRALFLFKANSNNNEPTSKQLQIATEWDEVETTLQHDAFWHFIYDEKSKTTLNNYDTKIEFIFDLMKNRKSDSEDYYTFYQFYDEIKERSIDLIWRDIKTYFNTFKEWYEDKNFYHLTGYLISTGKPVIELKNEYDKSTKTLFLKKLKEKILQTVSKEETGMEKLPEEIKDLNYGDNNVRNVLLLFNILILLDNNSTDIRFPFYRYKTEKWDVEHVYSQTDVVLEGQALKDYVKLIIEFWTGKKIANEPDDDFYQHIKEKILKNPKIEEYLLYKLVNDVYLNNDNQKAKDVYENLKDRLTVAFKEANIEARDNISNLVLLDRKTNRSYKNAFFPIKRRIILERIRQGSFIPLGTQNVFLKAYSKNFENIMYWTNEDATDYLNTIISTIQNFLNDKTNNNDN